jgi:hypothetical protein
MRYYDRKTGKRVSKTKWVRSHAHGGTRYVREQTVAQLKAGLKRAKENLATAKRDVKAARHSLSLAKRDVTKAKRQQALDEAQRKRDLKELKLKFLKSKKKVKRKVAPPPKKKTTLPQKTLDKAEYVLHFDYGRTRKANPIDVQVHLRGPANVSDKEVKAQYKTWWETRNLPRAWDVRAIAWKHKGGRRGSGEPNGVRDYLGFVLRTRAKRIT